MNGEDHSYDTSELSTETWPDFERLFAPGRGWAFCACMLYQRGRHLSARDFPTREAARIRNRAEKRELVERGRAHGIIVYADAEPVGWCQYGPVEELPLPGAERRDRRIPPVGEEASWRITCFVTARGYRRRGVAGVALRAALAAIGERGGGVVEAYPTRTPDDPNWVHAGTIALFEREGFSIVTRPSNRYVVMTREVAPAQQQPDR